MYLPNYNSLLCLFPRDKLYADTNIDNRKPWGAPFVDIFWYTDNGSHVSASQTPTMSWEEILPLTFRPLGKKNYPAPHDARNLLNTMYGKDWTRNCVSAGWDHLHARPKPKNMTITVECAALLKVYPFVRHIRGPGDAYCKEELMFQGRVVSTFVRSAKDIPVC